MHSASQNPGGNGGSRISLSPNRNHMHVSNSYTLTLAIRSPSCIVTSPWSCFWDSSFSLFLCFGGAGGKKSLKLQAHAGCSVLGIKIVTMLQTVITAS